MKLRHLAPILATTVALLPATRAQEGGGGSDPFAVQQPQESRFDLDLAADIPALDAIQLVSKQSGQPVNVVWTGASAQTLLPALRLHQVTLHEFYAAVTAAGKAELMQGRPGFAFEKVEGAPNIVTFTILPAPTPTVASDGVDPNSGLPDATFTDPSATPRSPGNPAAAPSNPVVLENPSHVRRTSPLTLSSPHPLVITRGAGTPPPPEKLSEFFDLEGMLNDDLTVDDLTTAIRTAWTAASSDSEPPTDALRFHKETQLLIITGRPEYLQHARSIIELLKARLLPSEDTKDREIRSLREELASSLKERDRLRKQLDQVEEESRTMARDLRAEIAKLEIELGKAGARQ